MNYWDYSSHRLMLRDAARTDAFSRALCTVVKPGDVVVDVGAGVGILSMLAAKAGAARVYAVERTGIAAMAASLAQANGLADRVFVQQCDIHHASIPEPVDVIVSEWMGTIGVDENMYGAVLWARDCWLKPEGRMIPATVSAWMAPVATDLRPDAAFFNDRPYGLDLAALAEPSIHELLMVRRRMRPTDLAAPAQRLWTSDARADAPSSVSRPYAAELRFTVERAGRVSALAAWFDSELAPGVNLSNAPDARDTHWGQLMLPLDHEAALAPGDIVETQVFAESVGPGPLQFAWACRINDGPWERHDTGSWGPAASAPATSAAADEFSFPTERSELSAFLADLSISPDLLAEFIANPERVMTTHQVSPAMQSALESRDPYLIQDALYASGSKS